MSDKPNCYKCKYRGIIPGDAHSQCCHPDVKASPLDDNYIAALAQSYIGKANGVKAKLGIQGGGPTWPANFNPSFLTTCNGFEAKSSSPGK